MDIRLSAKTIGQPWLIQIVPTDPPVETGWVELAAELRYGPSRDFDLIASSLSLEHPASETITLSGDWDEGYLDILISEEATSQVVAARCAGEERDLWLGVEVTDPAEAEGWRFIIPAVAPIVGN